VAGRIDVLDRVVSDVAVAVVALRVARRWHDRVGRDESREIRIVIPGAVIVEAVFGIELLAGEAVLGVYIAFVPADFSPSRRIFCLLI
jgi:hypothetical protein